jgi:hypothetical protein
LQSDLEGKGMQFVQADTAAFKQRLIDAGFYAEWKKKFPAAGWEQLESVVGSL